MNCDQARAFPPNASDEVARIHISTCPDCRLWLMSNQLKQSLDPKVENKILQSLTADLEPVRPIWSKSRSSAFLLLVSLCVAAMGILGLGTRGWAASSIVLRSCLSATVTLGLGMGAYLIPTLFIPGQLLKIRPLVAVIVIILAVVLPTFLRPVGTYQGFTRAVFTCVSIGLVHACVVAGIAYSLLRQGFAISRISTYTLVGSFAGLTGFTVLFVFCPHVDLAHHLLAHAGMVFVSMALGAWFARRLSKSMAQTD